MSRLASSARPSPIPSRVPTPNPPQDQKRKRPVTSTAEVWSQPVATGTGQELGTQMHFAVSHLKETDRPMTLRDITDYLSIRDNTKQSERNIGVALRRHPKVEYDEKGFGGKGSYRFRPIHNVRSGDDLLAFLQRQTTAQGTKVSELKEGWPKALETIEELEREGKLLITRNKKDSTPKMVWPNDPSLKHEVDAEFIGLWHDVKIPVGAGELRNELLAFGLTPTSQVKAVVKAAAEKKKKRAPRSGGKTTNTHMKDILKDYSHLRRG